MLQIICPTSTYAATLATVQTALAASQGLWHTRTYRKVTLLRKTSILEKPHEV
jgi:hypothetical protein